MYVFLFFREGKKMDMTIFVESETMRQMLSYKPYTSEKQEKKEVKYNMLDHIKNAIGDKWERLKEGTRQALDMVCFLSSERGFFYASDEYLADRHEISERTIQYRLKELEEMGQVVKVYRRAKRCNGRGKPVYLFVHHPYFQYWTNLIGLHINCGTDCETENNEIHCESKEEGGKKVPTYSLPTLKQESDITLAVKEKLQKYADYKINDILRKGVTVKYLSSYVGKMFKSLENQSLYYINNQQKKKKKQQKEENRAAVMLLNGINPSRLPFYNWLES